MKFKPIFIVFVFLSLCTGCNKNSNELPQVVVGPAAVLPDSLSKTLSINNLEVLRMKFYYYSSNVRDSVLVKLTNLTGQEMKNLSIVTEICRQLPMNFDNCNQARFFSGLVLKPDVETSLVFYPNGAFALRDSLIHNGIVGLNGSQHFLAGYYYNPNAYAYFIRDTTNTSGNFYGYLRGYVEADGQSVFRLKTYSNAYYNISGRFMPGNEFHGFLDAAGDLRPDITLDSLSVDGTKMLFDTTVANQLRLRFKLKDSLANGVTKIDLYLKK